MGKLIGILLLITGIIITFIFPGIVVIGAFIYVENNPNYEIDWDKMMPLFITWIMGMILIIIGIILIIMAKKKIFKKYVKAGTSGITIKKTKLTKQQKKRLAEKRGTGLTKEMAKSRAKTFISEKKADQEMLKLEKKAKRKKGISFDKEKVKADLYERAPPKRWKKPVAISSMCLGSCFTLLFGFVIIMVLQAPAARIKWGGFTLIFIYFILCLCAIIFGIYLLVTNKGKIIRKVPTEVDEVEPSEIGKAEVSLNKCPKCGWILSTHATKCVKCGWSEAEAEDAIKEPVQPKEAPPQKLTPLEQKDLINKEIAKIHQEIDEANEKFTKQEISQEEYLRLKNELYETMGELQGKLSLLD